MPDDRLFILWRLSDADSAVLRTESGAGRLHTWPPIEDLPEAQRIVDNLHRIIFGNWWRTSLETTLGAHPWACLP